MVNNFRCEERCYDFFHILFIWHIYKQESPSAGRGYLNCFYNSEMQKDCLLAQEKINLILRPQVILVPRAHDPSGLWQESRALAGPDFLSMRRVLVSYYQLAGPDFLSMRRVLVSYYQPIRFARFDGKSVNRGLPVLDPIF